MQKSEIIALAVFAALLAALFTFTACRDEAGLSRHAGEPWPARRPGATLFKSRHGATSPQSHKHGIVLA